MAKAPRTTFHYPTYHFRANEQDPIVDAVRTVLADHDISFAKAAKGSGVSYSTLHSWFVKGKTRKPQYASTAAVLGFAGYELVIAPKRRGTNGTARGPLILKRFPTRAKPTKPTT